MKYAHRVPCIYRIAGFYTYTKVDVCLLAESMCAFSFAYCGRSSGRGRLIARAAILIGI